MTRYLLDANIVLRFLRDDDPKLSLQATTLFANAAEGKCSLVLPTVVVAECVWVLRSFYGESHERIALVLSSLIASPGMLPDDVKVTTDALERMARTRLDYIDCYLAARGARSGDRIASFDRDLRKFDDIELWVPAVPDPASPDR